MYRTTDTTYLAARQHLRTAPGRYERSPAGRPGGRADGWPAVGTRQGGQLSVSEPRYTLYTLLLKAGIHHTMQFPRIARP